MLKHINFNRKIGQRTLDDDTLANFVQNFEKIPLRDENFEFPDLLGAAYEYLIKYLRRLRRQEGRRVLHPGRGGAHLVEIVEPQAGMSIYDPTCGSGGMLIQTPRLHAASAAAIRATCRSSARTSIGTTWSICKMNMLLHGIPHADIRQEDTIRKPQHKDENGRAQALRPGPRQSAVQPELHQERHRVPRPLRGAGCRKRARRPT